MERITIDPVTRLEGHGKIEIFLDPEGEVANAYFQIPELRGFERFCVGRPVEEMPTLTNRICGVCPEAHHLASVKACDAVLALPGELGTLTEIINAVVDYRKKVSILGESRLASLVRGIDDLDRKVNFSKNAKEALDYLEG